MRKSQVRGRSRRKESLREWGKGGKYNMWVNEQACVCGVCVCVCVSVVEGR